MANDHNSIEFERALLGLIIVNPSSINKINGYIKPEDFYNSKNKHVYQAISDVLEKGSDIEVVTIVNQLKQNGTLDKIGGDLYLAELASQAGLESNSIKYIKDITDKAQLRKVGKVIKKLDKEITEPNINVDTILEKVEQDILSSTREIQQKDFRTSKEIVEKMLENIEAQAAQKGISGLPSDLPSLDEMTSGFQKGDLIIIAARPSMGKTAFALNLAANISKNYKVAFFSLEMASEQLMKRIVSFEGGINGKKLQEPNKITASEWNKIHLASERASSLSLFIDDSAGIKLSEVVWKAKKLKKNQGLDMMVIDYLQLINVSGKSDNRQMEVSNISRTLKQLARELEIPVIALSQLSRKVEQRENKTPLMSDLRESGAIEQDADIIAFLYREAYYEKTDEEYQKTDIIIAKHRNGATGNIELSFKPSTGLFTDSPKKVE